MKLLLQLTSVATFLLLAPVTPAFQGGKKFDQLDLRIVQSGDIYTVEINNTSASDIKLPKVLFGDAAFSGYWLFLYDPKTKELQPALSNPLRAGPAKDWPRITLPAGAKLTNQFKKGELLKYFFTDKGRCYLLTAVYRKSWDGILYYASPAVPVKVCE